MEIGLASEEQGRELLAHELKPKTVVVINPPAPAGHVPYLITMFVASIDLVKHEVRFYSDVWKWIVTNRYDQRGIIYDDRGNTVHVYEYLGEV